MGSGGRGDDRGQARVTIYTMPGCLHCGRARRLLRRRGIAYSEVSVAEMPHFRAVLLELTGGTTVPQILFDDEPIGGASDLARLDRRGVLMARLGGERFPQPIPVRRLSLRRFARYLLTAPLGRGGGPWSHRVELIDRDGRSLGLLRRPPGGRAEAPR